MCYLDGEYNQIVYDILNNEEFKKLKNIEHHGMTRYDHSLRVSYYSYVLAKKIGLDYVLVSRAGLLHDFFFSEDDRTKKDRLVSTFIHPKFAVENSLKYFSVTEKEKNIIESHMFPLYKTLPKYSESWLVSIVDKVVATYEFSQKFKFKLNYATNLMILFIISKL